MSESVWSATGFGQKKNEMQMAENEGSCRMREQSFFAGFVVLVFLTEKSSMQFFFQKLLMLCRGCACKNASKVNAGFLDE